MKALGIELAELPEWQCCGAVYPIARDEIALRLSSVRALAAARDLNQPLVTLCSACHLILLYQRYAKKPSFRWTFSTI